MRFEEDGTDQRTLWCGNISDQVSDEILYELFLQAGPLESIRRPRDPNGRPKSFAFIVYKHECSVPYAVEIFRGEKLFNRALNLSSRSMLKHTPVLDTHISEFTDHSRNKPRHQKEVRDHRNDRKFSDKDDKQPTSWAELNAVRGKGSLLNGHLTARREDLLGAPMFNKESNSQGLTGSITDFEKLLQMGSQMMLPGVCGGLPFPLGGPMGPLNVMGPINLMGPSGPVGNNMGLMGHMYPSMQGEMSGAKHFSPERDRRSGYEGRGSRRDHPYQDMRRHNDRRNDDRQHSENSYSHRRHDRGYSSSRSSHERERRDRRSR